MDRCRGLVTKEGSQLCASLGLLRAKTGVRGLFPGVIKGSLGAGKILRVRNVISGLCAPPVKFAPG